MSAKWQEALKLWGSWQNSLDQARSELLSKYDGTKRLISRARKDDNFLGDLFDEMSDIYQRVIAKDIGFKSDSSYYEDFLYTWMHSVLPELIDEYDPDFDMVSDKRPLNIWLSSKLIPRQEGGFTIIDSVSWVRGRVKRTDIPLKIQEMEWLSPAQLEKRRRGGRPSEEDNHDLESVVCAILKDKQGLKHWEIGDYFGWGLQEHNFEKYSTSKNAYIRVRRGREILRKITG